MNASKKESLLILSKANAITYLINSSKCPQIDSSKSSDENWALGFDLLIELLNSRKSIKKISNHWETCTKIKLNIEIDSVAFSDSDRINMIYKRLLLNFNKERTSLNKIKKILNNPKPKRKVCKPKLKPIPDKKNKLDLYVDGSYKYDSNVGGWGEYFLLNSGEERELFGSHENTTSTQMELIAAIEGLKACPENTDINLFTDSKYVFDGITTLIKKQKKTDKEFWKQLINITLDKKINWNWVKAHSGNIGNEKADKLAKLAVKKH